MSSYRVQCSCRNCAWEGPLVVAKGKPVSGLTCPNCGTKSLVTTYGKSWRKAPPTDGS